MRSLDSMSVAELRQYADNCQRLNRLDILSQVVGELHRRRKASARDYSRLAWNHDRVARVFEPFVAISNTVAGNQRLQASETKGFTHAGGRRIAGELYVDSYTAIKTDRINAVFNCRITNPGDDPEFLLFLPKTCVPTQSPNLWCSAPKAEGLGLAVKRYIASELETALADWKQIADEARR